MPAPIIEVEPYNQDRWRKRQRTKLYYVGVNFHRDHGGNPPPVNIKGMPIAFPPLGEMIEIDEVYGRDLVQKSRYQQKPVYLSERDGGADVAKMIKQALKAGTKLEDFDLNKIKAKQEVKQMSDEELVEVLKDRRTRIDPVILRELLGDVPMEPGAKPSAPQIPVPEESQETEDEAMSAQAFAASPSPKSFKPKKL